LYIPEHYLHPTVIMTSCNVS